MTYDETVISHFLEVLEKNQSYKIMPFTDAMLIKMNNVQCVHVAGVGKAVYRRSKVKHFRTFHAWERSLK